MARMFPVLCRGIGASGARDPHTMATYCIRKLLRATRALTEEPPDYGDDGPTFDGENVDCGEDPFTCVMLVCGIVLLVTMAGLMSGLVGRGPSAP